MSNRVRTVPISTDQEFNRTSIAAVDFEKAIEFATAAQRYPANVVEYEALLFAALVCYVRPFSGNEKSLVSPAASRLSGAVLEALSKLERRQHDNCSVHRNKALAHSEFALNPTRLDHATGVVKSRPFSLLARPFDLPCFIVLAEKLSDLCQRDRAEYVLGRRRGASAAARKSGAG